MRKIACNFKYRDCSQGQSLQAAPIKMVVMNEMMGPEARLRFGQEEEATGSDPREDALYELIVSAVLARKLRAGERLNEQMLSEAHGISRTRVRRVLVRLQHANIVRFERNRGAFICRPTVKEAHDLFDVRRYLEECAVRAVVDRLAREPDFAIPAEEEDEDVTMHVARATGNLVLMRVIRDLLRQCALIQAVYGTQSPAEPAGHREILDRIRQRDASGAIQLVHRRLDAIVAALDLAGAEEAPDIYSPAR